MALVQRNLLQMRVIFSQTIRPLSASSKYENVKKSVFISQSKDIFTNLALENWIYKNYDLTNHHILMLWRNEPCAVIGRNQNPWKEANISESNAIIENGFKIARRKTDGSTVYHDDGNLNMTFFTPINHTNKLYNLDIVKRAIFRNYRIKLQTENENLTLRNSKVSETAVQLGERNGYHHCSLLVKVDKVKMELVLQKESEDIESQVTACSKTKLMNLCEYEPKMKTDTLFKAIGWEFLRTHAVSVTDGGMEYANQQKGFQMINPTEEWFPGISEVRNHLASWQWVFGHTPKFFISRTFTVPESLLTENHESRDFQVTMMVDNGRIVDVNLFIPAGMISNGFSGNVDVITNLRGSKFSENALTSLELSVEGLVNDKERFVTDCVRQVMFSA